MESPLEDMHDIVSSPIVRLEAGRLASYSIRREYLLRFRYFRALMLINPALAPKISVDADQHVFHHIVAYLRRGTFPLIMDAQGHHDISTYLAILEEARHFELDRLARWIEEGRFAAAAKIESTTTTRQETVVEKVNDTCLMMTTTLDDGKIVSNISRELYPAWGKRLVYQCPRGLHNGDRTGCGRKCNNALGGQPPSYDEVPTLRLLEVKKDLVIDPRLCRDPDW